MKYILIPSFVFAFVFNVYSQYLPSEYFYSDNARILMCGGKTSDGFYDPSIIRDIHFDFSQSNYWNLLKSNYQSETNIPVAMTIDGEVYDVGVRFRGNTSYMMVQFSDKKSFAVETDFIDPDLRIMGYKNLKFNNAHEDPSFMREVLYGRMASKYIPIAKANYIHLNINGSDWGLYPNIQAIDKTFLEQWFMSNDGARFRATTDEVGINPPGPGGPGWGDGTAGMNYLGDDTLQYQKYYSLKSSDIENPWNYLIGACKALNEYSIEDYSEIENILDIDKILWFLAIENIFTDDDSYTMKGKMDYMVYYEPETGRTTSLEYDGNSTFQINRASSNEWNPFKNVENVNYPLLNKLLNTNEYRQRYLAHYRTILNENFTEINSNKIINDLNSQISSLVSSDPKKLYTYSQFNSDVSNLKSFIKNRRNYLLSNNEVSQVGPVIDYVNHYTQDDSENGTTVPPGEAINIKAHITSNSGINSVKLYYCKGIVGRFSKTNMFDDGNHNDGVANDGVFGASIPAIGGGSLVRYYVEAISNNSQKSVTYMPSGAEHDVFYYYTEPEKSSNGVVINELMASNTTTVSDENGDFDDWFELYNNNSFDVDLSGLYLSDKDDNLKKWEIPEGTKISKNGYLIFWADEDEEDGLLHTNFKLSTSGEVLILSDSTGSIIDRVQFGEQQQDMGLARVPNGTGEFVIQIPTFNANNDSVLGNDNVLNKISPIILYPNPVRDILYIANCDEKEISVFNSLGQRIDYIKFKGNLIIDFSKFKSGLYYLVAGKERFKVVKI